MNLPFEDKPYNIQRWMNNKGFPGKVVDSTENFFKSKNTSDAGSLYDNIRMRLNTLGYTGTIKDQLNAFFTAKTGIGGPDGERRFWGNLGGDFT